MKETGRTQAEREMARLRTRNQAKSPVKENVRKFEGKPESPVQENVKKFEGKSQSPVPGTSRSKSPNVNSQRPTTLYSPTRSKSPGLSSSLRNKSPGLASPLRSKSPGASSPIRSQSPGVSSPIRSQSQGVSSPIRSKSPGVSSPIRSKSPLVPTRNEFPTYSSPRRSKSPGIDTYNRSMSPAIDTNMRSKSPGIDTYTRSKSPGVSSINRAKSPLANSPSRSKSPGIVSESPASSPTKSPGVFKWTKLPNGWTKEDVVVPETVNYTESTPDDEKQASDELDISWYFDNIDYITDTKAPETKSQAVEDIWPGAENSGNIKRIEQRFRNSLNYNIAAWNDEDYEDKPKKADDFIQRLCDQVRNHVEYLCGLNFINYKAISYKVRVAGVEGIFYYVKVNVWQNYCLHLRIFSGKNELKAVPVLQAILERAQPDNGNIEFF